MRKRLVSIILVLTILSSFIVVVPVSAAGFGSQSTAKNVVVNTSARNYWDAQFDSWFSNVPIVGTALNAIQWKDMCWALMDTALPKYGEFDNLSSLTDYARQVWARLNSTKLESINDYLNQVPDWDILRAPFKYLVGKLVACRPTTVSVEQFAGYGWCVSDGKGNMLCRSGGQIAYYMEPEQAEGEAAAVLGGKWVDAAFRGGVPGLHLYSYRSTLETVADRLCDLGQTCGVQSWTYKNEKYWYILKERGSSVYADKQGRPYVVRQSSDYAVDKNQNYYAPGKDSGDTFNQQLVDLLTGVLNAPRDESVTQGDNSLYLEDGAIYNPDNRTYSFTATNSFNTTNNTYYTYNYHYEYHINYTSVTYIGTTAEYDQIYEYYYELPDGRSSADLTAEELLALNTEVDVVPYTRSTDNTALRSLYHLDGNVKDASYWNYLTSWDWTEGASITYMESPSPFGGYLYLDETTHKWSITLPSGLGSQDFTLQFRLYQKATVTPQKDSYIAFSSDQVLYFDGGDFEFNGTAHLMPVGTWNEFALIRDSGTLRLYLNGVQVDSYINTSAYGNKISFCFGSMQQATKGLDEVRVLNYALQTGGANYDAATAPYDTNLSLVLPDSSTPVADEYWTFDTAIEPKVTWNFSEQSVVTITDGSVLSDGISSPYVYNDGSSGLLVSPNLMFTSFSHVGDSVDSFVPLSSSSYAYYWRASAITKEHFSSRYSVGGSPSNMDFFAAPHSALKFPCYFGNSSLTASAPTSSNCYRSGFSSSDLGATFTFSILLADGSISSLTFDFTVLAGFTETDSNSRLYGYYVFNSAAFDWGSIYFVGTSGKKSTMVYPGSVDIMVLLNAGQTLDIVYAEIVPGSIPNTGHEFVSAVAPVNTDFKTPTLAVRTDQTITGYQIGGVRPSLPEKGLVYALVENSRITSLQIYNGSMWEKVDGRIWTGSRWVPYYAYDILLFKDLWDIVEADPSQDYIYTESGFWSWLQKAWAQMIVLLTDIRDRITGGSGSTGVDSSVVGPDSSTLPPVTDDDGSGWSFIDLASVLVKSGWKICTGTVTLVFGGLSGMTDAVTNLADGFNGFDFMGRYDGTISEFSGVLDYAESSADSSG